MALTDAQIKALKPKASRYLISDGRGLSLDVLPSGKMSWLYRYRLKGDNGHFFYNRAVANVNVTNIHNVYNTTVENNTTINRVSYNGGCSTATGCADRQA
jgi:hypothetical protein